MVSRDLLPMARGCARRQRTGKPLQIAVNDVTGTTEATPFQLILVPWVAQDMIELRQDRIEERQRIRIARQ